MAQHSSKGARFQAVTANRLNDGEVVYFKDNGWIENFAEAEIADGQEAAEALLTRASSVIWKHLFSTPIYSRSVSVRTVLRQCPRKYPRKRAYSPNRFR